MTNKLIAAISALLVVGAGVFTWQQRQATVAQTAHETALAAELKEKTDALAAKEAQLANLQRENDKRSIDALALPKKIAKREKKSAPPSAAASSPSTSGPESFAELFRRTMDDPRTRDVRYQRIWTDTKQVYGDFARLQRLTPEDTEKFLALIFGREANEMEDASNFFSGDTHGPGPSGKDAETIAGERKEIDSSLQETLGTGGYAAFQEYEKTVSDRDRLFEIRGQLAIGAQALSEDQANFLLQALLEERAKTPPLSFDPGGAAGTREKYNVGVQGDNAAQYLEAQAHLDKRFLARAQPILTSEQYSALEGFQQQNIEIQKAGIEVARKVIEKANNTPAPKP